MNNELVYRYQNDPKFHAMVETIVVHCYALDFESRDVIDALTLATSIIEAGKRHSNRVKYVCGCEAADDNIAATCPIHGYPVELSAAEEEFLWER